MAQAIKADTSINTVYLIRERAYRAGWEDAAAGADFAGTKYVTDYGRAAYTDGWNEALTAIAAGKAKSTAGSFVNFGGVKIPTWALGAGAAAVGLMMVMKR